MAKHSTDLGWGGLGWLPGLGRVRPEGRSGRLLRRRRRPHRPGAAGEPRPWLGFDRPVRPPCPWRRRPT